MRNLLLTFEAPAKALIITALPTERRAVIQHLQNRREERLPTGSTYDLGSFQLWDVVVAHIAPGNVSAALETERAIAHFRPDVALFVGIAGGVKDVQLGDVVAATKVYAYEAGADRTKLEPRPDVGLSSYPLVQEARRVARLPDWHTRISPLRKASHSLPSAFIGAIAAGEKVVKNSEGAVATLLKESYSDTLAVEMEGAGFMRSAYSNSLDAMVIRGISDLLDGKSDADKSGTQDIAADNAAAFAFALLAGMSIAPASASSTAQSVSTAISNSAFSPIEEIVDFWTRLRELAPRLYPKGPDDNNVWQDAGGDLSYLDLTGNGRTQWSRAIQRLKNGGGDLTPKTLLERMLDDFGRNLELKYLLNCVEE